MILKGVKRMSQCRRCYQAGGSYFFTLVTHQRRHILNNPKHIKQFKESLNKVKEKLPFSLNAIVILLDHLHCLWRLPESDEDYSTRWRLIKRYFSMEMNAVINHRREKEVWQRRFWEHSIRNERDWQKHMDYIHYNPVKHGWVEAPKDWPYSSFHHWVEKGVYEKSWGSMEPIVFTGMKEAE